MNSSTEKNCKQCKQLLPLDQFYFQKTTKDNRDSTCKKCSNIRRNQNRKKQKKNRTRNTQRENINAMILQMNNDKLSYEDLITHSQNLLNKLCDIQNSQDSPTTHMSLGEFMTQSLQHAYDPQYYPETETFMSQKGYLYALIEREHIKTQNFVYKIGYTDKYSPFKRIKQYPKNSKVKIVIEVSNAQEKEHQLKHKLNKLCSQKLLKHRKDLGLEYYEGNFNLIKKVMLSIQ